VLDHAGGPATGAEVRLVSSDRKALASTSVGSDGAIELTLEGVKDRLARVELAGSGQRAETLFVVTDQPVAEGEFPKPTEDERAMARRLLEEVDPADVLWSFGSAFANVIQLTGESGNEARIAAFVDKQSETAAVAAFLLEQLRAKRGRGDLDALRPLVTKLETERFNGTVAQMLARSVDPDRPTAPGKPVPEFELQAIVSGKLDPKKTYSPKTFAGQLLLIDVWATWCKPCVVELPRLHAIQAKYGNKKGKRLSVLSISLDETVEAVAGFRRDKAHPMPWHNAFAGKDQAALGTAFAGDKTGVAVPFYLLADEHGSIVASSPDLTIEKLEGQLDRLLP
jgi:thiol-disulfide isomerase/thioredoxin